MKKKKTEKKLKSWQTKKTNFYKIYLSSNMPKNIFWIATEYFEKLKKNLQKTLVLET